MRPVALLSLPLRGRAGVPAKSPWEAPPPRRAPTLLSGLLLASVLCASGVRAGEPHTVEDAALHAVQFIDDNEGWAVGDEGAIWHSIDGGKNWELQRRGGQASLRSVYFINPYVGWVAGREETPGGKGAAGVVLYTQDGGVSWQRLMLNALPGLNVVRFVNPKVGYLLGDGADQYPSGVFATADGGKTWQPVPGPRCPSWLAADFNEEAGGALAGAWNRLATVRRDRVHMADVDTLGGRNLRGLYLAGKRGVAVGQGGLVLLSDSTGGSSWRFADPGLPAEVREVWDFHAVHGAGRHLWAVGRPGSVVLHSRDQGEHWEVQRTGQTLPLNSVYFRDEQHGWAVGEFGLVVLTTDGGKTWQVRRRGGQRCAALFVHARAAGVPLDTVAVLGGQEGYLTTGLRVTAADPSSAAPARTGEPARFSAAFRQAGGAAAETLWQFPLASHLARGDRKEIVQAWDQLHGDRAAEQLIRQLVLALRTWQPAVVITDNPDPNTCEFSTDCLLAEAVQEAFRAAADPKAFPEQLHTLGLEAWKAVKLYGRWEGRTEAPVLLDLTTVSPRLGTSAQEFAAGPSALVAEGNVAVPKQRGYRLLADHLTGAANHRQLMEGVSIPPGGLARRPLPAVADLPPEQLKAVRQQANLRGLIEAPPGSANNPDRLLSQIGPLLAELPDDQAAQYAYAIANQYARMGQWSMAREAFLLMVDRYPAHPLALDAYRWLIRYNSSSEARRRHELGQFLVVGERELGVVRPGGNVPAEKPSDEKKQGRLPEVPEIVERRTEQLVLLGSKEDVRKWYQGSLALEERLKGFGPLFAADPAVQFCLQAARRNLGDFEAAKKWYSEFAGRQPDGPWRSAALAELWLMNRTGHPPKPVASCRLAEERPFLDGKLDDACWQGGQVLRLQNATGETAKEYPTEVRLAYDKDFLYVAARCFHPADRRIPTVKGRSRDADLHAHDRVSLLLDLDRDYSTAFHLQIDQRGCVAEDCWGDKSWDPRWFVAVQSEPTCWVIEAAIPLAALTGDNVTPGRAWACNVVRTLPGRGVQAWSLPAEAPEEAPRLEGMGLLMFAASDKANSASLAPQPGAQTEKVPPMPPAPR
jgi:photosystem II stability/assembly factor-like uncharacterized protein/tetratricopeptide (TPR) repeat protein